MADRVTRVSGKVDIRLPGKGNFYSHGARPVHQIISMVERIRTGRLSLKHSLSGVRSCGGGCHSDAAQAREVRDPSSLSLGKLH